MERKKNKAHFWWKLWLDSGKKKDDIVYPIIKKTWKEYHQSVRSVKILKKYLEDIKIIENSDIKNGEHLKR